MSKSLNPITLLQEWLGCIIAGDQDELKDNDAVATEEFPTLLVDPSSWNILDAEPDDVLNLIFLDHTFHQLAAVAADFEEENAPHYFKYFGSAFFDTDPHIKLSITGYLNNSYCREIEVLRTNVDGEIATLSLKGINDYVAALTATDHTSHSLIEYILEELDSKRGDANFLKDPDVNQCMFELSNILNTHLPILATQYWKDSDDDLISRIITSIFVSVGDFATDVIESLTSLSDEDKEDLPTTTFSLIMKRIEIFGNQLAGSNIA